ncbi:MAG TPA: UrcA family protein [Steroidobacteraceae bacterium]|nr:UrcA family protein [Steroidobacteraceae bacterium]
MITNTVVMSARALLGAVTVASMLFAGSAAAKDYTVTVALHVSAQGLNLSQSADARTFYRRLENAAYVACTDGYRVGLDPVDDFKGCYQKALGDAIRSLGAPLVTQIYLATHTLQEAAARGIEVPAQLAAK